MGLQRQHPMKTTLCNSLLRREHCSVPKPSPGALLRMPKLCVFCAVATGFVLYGCSRTSLPIVWRCC